MSVLYSATYTSNYIHERQECWEGVCAYLFDCLFVCLV